MHDVRLQSQPWTEQLGLTVRAVLVCLIATVTPLAPLLSQNQVTPPPGGEFRSPFSHNVGFQQHFNTYIWLYQVEYRKAHARGVQVEVRESFRSSLQRASSLADRWNDDQQLRVKIAYPVGGAWRLNWLGSSTIFSDRQSGYGNDYQTHATSIGVLYQPGPRGRFSAQAGPVIDHRFSIEDRGWAASAEMLAADQEWGGYFHHVSATARAERYALRTNNTQQITYRVNRLFYRDTADSLSVNWNRIRREYYTAATADVERFQEGQLVVDNVFRYALPAGVRFGLRTRLTSKQVSVTQLQDHLAEASRQREDFGMSNRFVFQWERAGYAAATSVFVERGEQQYEIPFRARQLPFSQRAAFVAPDNEFQRAEWNTRLRAQVSSSDSLTFSSSIHKLKFDTPDTNNFDDRDELRINVNLVWDHLWTSRLTTRVIAGVSLYHRVYIFGERSADNNWLRIFRLSPSVRFRPSERFRLVQSAEVVGNYTVYDFEGIEAANPRSIVFRQFSVTDSLEFQVTDRSTFQLAFELENEEIGRIIWREWLERPARFRRSLVGQVLWVHRLWSGVQVGVGGSYFFRHTDRFVVRADEGRVRTPVGDFRTYGPILRLMLTSSEHLQTFFSAQRQRLEGMDGSRRILSNIEFQLTWEL